MRFRGAKRGDLTGTCVEKDEEKNFMGGPVGLKSRYLH